MMDYQNTNFDKNTFMIEIYYVVFLSKMENFFLGSLS